jgi:hypothetical protein
MHGPRIFGVIFTGVLALAGLDVIDAAAQASVPRVNAALCTKLTIVQPSLSDLGNKSFDAGPWKSAGKALKNAAKSAPGKVKDAVATMGTYYAKIGKAGTPAKALNAISANDTAKFTKASIVYEKYLAKNCA